MKRFFWLLLVLAFILGGAGCRLQEDRCWVDDYRYREAKKVYEETQVLDLVRRELKNQHDWRKCEINEVIYRLKKDHHMEE